jgi:putative transposase
LISIDKNRANKAGIKGYNTVNNRRIKTRQCKHLNNIIEHDQRFIKRKTKVVLGFKNSKAAQKTPAEVELIRMLKKEQILKNTGRC